MVYLKKNQKVKIIIKKYNIVKKNFFFHHSIIYERLKDYRTCY